jgi:checkpoint serine/threonine-protein kinase
MEDLEVNPFRVDPSPSHSEKFHLTSVPSPSRSSTPELADIEAAKENIAPLPQGRSAKALTRIVNATHESRAQYLSASHDAFKHEIEGCEELDDPLDVFWRYLGWIMENYPHGNSHDSNLLTTLELAARKFKDDPRYKDDHRYLKCWLAYAGNVKDPVDIYEYVYRNQIGSNFALFYESYACYLEEVKEQRVLVMC